MSVVTTEMWRLINSGGDQIGPLYPTEQAARDARTHYAKPHAIDKVYILPAEGLRLLMQIVANTEKFDWNVLMLEAMGTAELTKSAIEDHNLASTLVDGHFKWVENTPPGEYVMKLRFAAEDPNDAGIFFEDMMDEAHTHDGIKAGKGTIVPTVEK